MNTFDKMVSFTKKRFPKASTGTHIAKIKEEADEALSSIIKSSGQVDLEELADILLALYAATGKAGFTESQLNSATERKLKILKKRKWEWTDNMQYQHKPD